MCSECAFVPFCGSDPCITTRHKVTVSAGRRLAAFVPEYGHLSAPHRLMEDSKRPRQRNPDAVGLGMLKLTVATNTSIRPTYN